MKTRRLNILVTNEVARVLKENSGKMGLSMSAYVAYLIMQKDMEIKAMAMVGSLTEEQIREAIKEELKEK